MQGLRMGCEGQGMTVSGVPVNMYFKEEEELKMSNSTDVSKEDREIAAFVAQRLRVTLITAASRT